MPGWGGALYPREPSEQLEVLLFSLLLSARSLPGLSYAGSRCMVWSPTRCFEERIRPSLYPSRDASEL